MTYVPPPKVPQGKKLIFGKLLKDHTKLAGAEIAAAITMIKEWMAENNIVDSAQNEKKVIQYIQDTFN